MFHSPLPDLPSAAPLLLLVDDYADAREMYDLSLPGIGDWERARILKGDARTTAIPIIALTAHGLNGEQARALEAGCDALVTRPCLPQTLAAEFSRVLQGVGLRS